MLGPFTTVQGSSVMDSYLHYAVLAVSLSVPLAASDAGNAEAAQQWKNQLKETAPESTRKTAI